MLHEIISRTHYYLLLHTPVWDTEKVCPSCFKWIIASQKSLGNIRTNSKCWSSWLTCKETGYKIRIAQAQCLIWVVLLLERSWVDIIKQLCKFKTLENCSHHWYHGNESKMQTTDSSAYINILHLFALVCVAKDELKLQYNLILGIILCASVSIVIMILVSTW